MATELVGQIPPIICKSCKAEVMRDGNKWRHKTSDSRYHKDEIEPVYPSREVLLIRYNTEAAIAAEASLDVARFERKKSEAQRRYETAKGLRDELKRLLSEHPDA